MDNFSPEFLFSDNPDAVLREQYAAAISAARAELSSQRWQHGRKLRILLSGYSGAQNTGAEVRTVEIVRQIYSVLGEENIELGLLVVGARIPVELQSVKAEVIDCHPPLFLQNVSKRYDCVIVCEGSLFTSTFSDGLAVLLSSFLSIATAQGKPAIAFGAEADAMTPDLEAFVRKHCRDALILARNEPSLNRLKALGLNVRSGTDTGWSFIPRAPRSVDEILRDAGWDGRSEIVAICPVNPFWWPLSSDPQRAMLLKLQGEHDSSHYGGVSFHHSSEEAVLQFNNYLDAIARAFERHAERHDVFPIVIGMEPLDREACEGIAKRLSIAAPILSGEHEANTLVALLRASQRIVSSRFHAVLLSMSAGVPATALAYDQRMPALFDEAGHPEQVLRVDDPALEDKLVENLSRMVTNKATLAEDFRLLSIRNLRAQAEMGRELRSEILRHFPSFPLPAEPLSWSGYLPSLDSELEGVFA